MDNIVIFSTDLNELEQMLNELSRAAKKAGLEMNLEKTQIMSNSDKQCELEHTNIQNVEKYIYNISSN